MFGESNGTPEKNDPIIMILIFCSVILVLLAVLWFIFHTEFSIAAIYAAWVSLPVLTMIVKSFIAIGSPDWLINLVVPFEVINQIPILREDLLRQDPRQVDFEYFVTLLNITGYAFRPFLPFLTGALIYYIIKNSRAARLKRSMNIFGLSKVASETFPQIRPAIMENLFQVNPDQGEFRREESPIRYAIQNKLIQTYDVDFKKHRLETIGTPTFNKKDVDDKKKIYLVEDDLAHSISKLHDRCIFDAKAADDIFITQLGVNWTSSDDLSPMMRGLYAALIAFACADKDTSFRLLEQFNKSWKTKKFLKLAKKEMKKGNLNPPLMDLSGVDGIILKFEKRREIQEILFQHGFVTTVMQRLLHDARTKGRISTSLFLWLKVYDRNMWYCLNQEGGQCSWVESSGPRAHLLAERSANGALFHPFTETATVEYENYLSESEGWIPKKDDA